MLLHMGQDYIVDTKDIIGIFDIETTSTQKITREFLKRAEDEGAVVTLQPNMLPKSFLVADFPDNIVYVSPIAPATLKARGERYKIK